MRDTHLKIKYAGLFMALQPRIVACGTKRATMGMAIRFLCGPLVMSLTSIAIGLRGKKLHTAIVQVLMLHIRGMNLNLYRHMQHMEIMSDNISEQCVYVSSVINVYRGNIKYSSIYCIYIST